ALLLNCTAGTASLEALKLAGEANLAGKVLIDIANPLDFSKGAPSMATPSTDSLGEQIQRAFPKARVVKALNTVNAAIMADPNRLASAGHDVFVCGNDRDAKQEVRALLASLGWKSIVDLGDLTAARGTEMYLMFWLKLYGAFKTPEFNIKVVR